MLEQISEGKIPKKNKKNSNLDNYKKMPSNNYSEVSAKKSLVKRERREQSKLNDTFSILPTKSYFFENNEEESKTIIHNKDNISLDMTQTVKQPKIIQTENSDSKSNNKSLSENSINVGHIKLVERILKQI